MDPCDKRSSFIATAFLPTLKTQFSQPLTVVEYEKCRMNCTHHLIDDGVELGAFYAMKFNRELSKLRGLMTGLLRRFWTEDNGQDIAEYAVMLAVILVLVVGTVRLVGSNANRAFSSVASSLQ